MIYFSQFYERCILTVLFVIRMRSNSYIPEGTSMRRKIKLSLSP